MLKKLMYVILLMGTAVPYCMEKCSFKNDELSASEMQTAIGMFGGTPIVPCGDCFEYQYVWNSILVQRPIVNVRLRDVQQKDVGRE